jgi:hypothetical protein
MDPVELKNPAREEVLEEYQQRLSLRDAMLAEAKLMKKVSKIETLNKHDKSAAKMIAFALEHLVYSWETGKSVNINEEKLEFYKEDDI